ncbi:hypothetical protein ACKKBG_A01905 [Auxenochlorella protothecoides x Auxenochlorella symbiontica]
MYSMKAHDVARTKPTCSGTQKSPTMRVDIWDVKPKEDLEALDAGLPKNFDSLFELGATLGKGGFGLVRVATEKATGQEYACKSVCKRLNIPNLSAAKQAAHIDNIKREIAILKRLRGTLSVVVFKGAYEDDEDIHILMELCRGGELEHELGRRPYSEKLVAGYMRSVLYTLAQCHSLHILHRDIKPGNFMLLTTEIDSPLKAIDFGLAVFYDPAKLPRTDLGLEGTTWFMAPETLSSDVYPASDVWAAGVMAYQLLSGVLPFNDRRNPNSPSLSLIWRSILTDTPSFTTSAWSEVSEEGKDFVRKLLEKDHKKRPSAKDMLGHAWLQSSFYTTNARPISASVVQRLQRFSQAPMLKRSILELIAAELLEVAPPQLDPSVHGMSSYSRAASKEPGKSAEVGESGPGLEPALSSPSPSGDDPQSILSRADSLSGSSSLRIVGRSQSVHGGRFFARSPSSQALSLLASAHEKNQRARMRDGSGPPSSEGSAHGEKEYWRVLRAASELALMGSQHGKTKALEYLHTHPRSEEEIGEQRKAARLALDTSTHGGSDYDRLLRRLEEESKRPDKAVLDLRGGMRGSRSTSSLASLHKQERKERQKRPAPSDPPAAAGPGSPVGRRGAPGVPVWPGSAGASLPASIPEEPESEQGGRRRGGSAALAALGRPSPPARPQGGGEEDVGHARRVTFNAELPSYHAGGEAGPGAGDRRAGSSESNAAPAPESGAAAPGPAASARPISSWPAGTQSPGAAPPSSVDPGAVTVTTPAELSRLMRKMRFRPGEALSAEALCEALHRLGYDLEPSEVSMLLRELDRDADGAIHPSEFVASQLDWGAMQQSNRDLWLECARRAFSGLDTDKDGRVDADALLSVLRSKLPAAEVDYAVEHAMVEAGHADADDMDFEGFLRLLHMDAGEASDALHLYDARMPADLTPDLDPTVHNNGSFGRLDSIEEAA